jgi:hypothetical protein
MVVVACFVFSGQVFADPVPPPPPPTPPDVPIDGGVAGLLILGLGYGARKLYLQNEADTTKVSE